MFSVDVSDATRLLSKDDADFLNSLPQIHELLKTCPQPTEMGLSADDNDYKLAMLQHVLAKHGRR